MLLTSDIVLKDNEELNIDGLNIKCIYTPGHTNCGVCYLINNEKLFTGDTLFLRSVGRSDLPTGDGDTLVKSIKPFYTHPNREFLKIHQNQGNQAER